MILPFRSSGIMEFWNNGIVGKKYENNHFEQPEFLRIHHSSIPS
jgi:hypothetical protein